MLKRPASAALQSSKPKRQATSSSTLKRPASASLSLPYRLVRSSSRAKSGKWTPAVYMRHVDCWIDRRMDQLLLLSFPHHPFPYPLYSPPSLFFFVYFLFVSLSLSLFLSGSLCLSCFLLSCLSLSPSQPLSLSLSPYFFVSLQASANNRHMHDSKKRSIHLIILGSSLKLRQLRF